MNTSAEPATNPAPEPAPLAFTTAEACNHLRITRTTLYAWMNTGKLRTAKVGGKRLVPAAEVHRLLGLEAA